MEYESRKVKWYWMLLFILFCGGVIYLLFSANPYLYSHIELRSALSLGDTTTLQTIPIKPATIGNSGAATFWPRYNEERTAMDPIGSPRSRAYVEVGHFAINETLDPNVTKNITGDSSGFFLSGKTPWVVCVDLEDGHIRWKYRFLDLPPEQSVAPVILDEASAFLAHPKGRLVSLDKKTGQLHWALDLNRDLAAPPFIWQANVAVPVKGDDGIDLIFVRRADGQINPKSSHLDAKPDFSVSFDSSLERGVILTFNNKVIAVDPAEDWEVLWSQTLTDPAKGAAVAIENQIFVATLGAKIVKLDGSKKGKQEWEADLVKPAAGPPTYLPIMHKLAVMDTAGALSIIDAKSGKVFWQNPTENRNPLTDTWSARLKGQNIQEFKMDWLHRGWTIWSPCSDRQFCIYTPGKGQLIQRVPVTGSLLALPVALSHGWVFLTQNKPGHYVVSRFLEESEAKKLNR